MVNDLIADLLISNNIVVVDEYNNFLLSSGKKSKIYVDCRKITSLPTLRKQITNILVEEISKNIPSVDVICGIATGSVPLAMLVAEQMQLPFIYHRTTKLYGMGKRIEGIYSDRQDVVVIEDVVTTGNSAVQTIVDLENEKLKVQGLFAIYSGSPCDYQSSFNKHEINFFSLTDLLTLLRHLNMH